MSSASSVAATLRPETRQQIAVEALAKSKPISHLATDYEVSRKFIYEQSGKAKLALSKSFEPTTPEHPVLFHLPITKAWLCQLILGLVLICHSSLRGVVELLRDVFDVTLSASTVRDRLNTAAEQASAINATQGLSPIEVDLRDEIFQAHRPVLVGMDAASTYCYLLKLAEHRDADTWGCHLLDAIDQGLAPTRTIAMLEAGSSRPSGGLWGRNFLSWRCLPSVASMPERLEQPHPSGHGATTQRQDLEQKMVVANQKDQGHRLSKQLALARQHEASALSLARDVKTLIGWLNHDVLELAGPALAERQELYDFVVAELQRREAVDGKKVRVLRKALQNQRDDILGFAQVLDDKLADIARQLKTPLPLLREMCLLCRECREQPTSNAYWQAWNQLQQKLSGQFHQLYEAVKAAMKQTPRASSMAENLNSRLRNYLFLRKQLGPDYLNLLQFF